LRGACNEILENNETAIDDYQKAKFLLEENEASIRDVSFSELSLYSRYFELESDNSQEEDVLLTQFESAKKTYFAEDYEAAKVILESLVADLESVEGRETLKGETFLLMGATYEKLEYFDLAIKYYCKAKDILGEGQTIEGLDLDTLTYYRVKCKTATGIAVYVLIGQFGSAKKAYFAENYAAAKITLEGLVADIRTLEGWDSFKGEFYLLIGATYEKLEYVQLSIRYYCRAKEILGEGKTIEGLDLKTLKYYKEDCRGVIGVIGKAKKKKGGFGKLIGTILGIAVLGGIVWYLFFSKNAPFKKKTTEEVYVYRSSCFTTLWSFFTESWWSGSIGTTSISPDTAPDPDENNNWDDSVTYTLSASGGGSLISIKLTMTITVGGGDNATRTDVVWVDGVEVLRETNTFTNTCSNKQVRVYTAVYERSSTGSFTVRHKVELSGATNR